MTVIEELSDWLDDHIPDKQKNKKRDMSAVLDFYGFGETSYPTYQEIADNSGSLSRERVRQILNASFRDHIDPSEVPICTEVAATLDRIECASLEYIEQRLSSLGLVGEQASVRGLLNLASDLGYCQDREIYDCNLDRLSRSWSEKDGVALIVRKSHRDRYKKLLTRARTLPGRHGLVTFNSLRDDLGESEDTERIIQIIRATPNVVVVEAEGREWYMYQDRENSLLSFCEKAFTLADRYEIGRFCDCMEGALYQRTQDYPRPTNHVIQKWLGLSSLFEVEGGRLTMPNAQNVVLHGAEALVADYLADGKKASYEDIYQHKPLAGYSPPMISNACMKSPVVYVDKTLGRKAYTYQLISYAAAPEAEQEHPDRYQQFKKRLQRLATDGTNLVQEVLMRREQNELRKWVIRNAAVVHCAICGKPYSQKAVVAAHKKKRAQCTEAERTDPHIVFPLCTFGCDHLYEHSILRIRAGQVVAQHLPVEGTTDREWATSVDGRVIDEAWREGPTHYFEEADL